MRPCIEREIKDKRFRQTLENAGMHIVDDNQTEVLSEEVQEKLEKIDEELREYRKKLRKAHK